jgi:MFS family permease
VDSLFTPPAAGFSAYNSQDLRDAKRRALQWPLYPTRDTVRLMSNLTRMTIISFILFMSLGITGPVSSLYYAFLGANYVEIGLLGTVTSLTVIIFGFVWGGASDSLGGRKPFLITGLAALALIHSLIAIASSYHYLFPLRALGAILGSSMGGIQTQLMGFRAMIGTNAALIFGGAVYLAATARQLRVARKHGVL